MQHFTVVKYLCNPRKSADAVTETSGVMHIIARQHHFSPRQIHLIHVDHMNGRGVMVSQRLNYLGVACNICRVVGLNFCSSTTIVQ